MVAFIDELIEAIHEDIRIAETKLEQPEYSNLKEQLSSRFPPRT